MNELFTRYGPEPPPEGHRVPECVVAYPEPCGGPAVGEGWGCLPLCEAHWREAEMAARDELSYAVGNELDILISAEGQRPDRNRAVVAAPDTAVVPGWGLEDRGRYAEALAAAYPVAGRDDLLDPDMLRFDYGRYEGDGPVEWWTDERRLLLRFMRQASGEGLPRLVQDLERLRERVTVQEILAERDYERRYAAPRRAAREAKAGG